MWSLYLNATTIAGIDAAFATLARQRADALFVAADAFFVSHRAPFITLTARDRIPATYSLRDYVEAGGLMSYGTDIAHADGGHFRYWHLADISD